MWYDDVQEHEYLYKEGARVQIANKERRDVGRKGTIIKAAPQGDNIVHVLLDGDKESKWFFEKEIKFED